MSKWSVNFNDGTRCIINAENIKDVIEILEGHWIPLQNILSIELIFDLIVLDKIED